MMNGAINTPGVTVIAANILHASCIREEFKGVKIVTLRDLGDKMRGTSGPILIDHYALDQALGQAVGEINHREQQLRDVSRELKTLSEKINSLLQCP